VALVHFGDAAAGGSVLALRLVVAPQAAATSVTGTSSGR
jgi:hypothetical protein